MNSIMTFQKIQLLSRSNGASGIHAPSPHSHHTSQAACPATNCRDHSAPAEGSIYHTFLLYIAVAFGSADQQLTQPARRSRTTTGLKGRPNPGTIARERVGIAVRWIA